MTIQDHQLAPANISWWHIIMALEKHGYRQSDIGAAVGASRSAVESWKNRYVEPNYESGQRLIQLWSAVVLPRREKAGLSAAAVK